jgi:hypothetical protein
VDGELRPVVENLNQPLDLHEIVAVKRADCVLHVVPHLGVHFAGAVSQQQGEVKLAGLLLPDLL